MTADFTAAVLTIIKQTVCQGVKVLIKQLLMCIVVFFSGALRSLIARYHCERTKMTRHFGA